MPIMVLACNMSPTGIEATFYSFITACINLGYLVSYQVGAAMLVAFGITGTDFDNLFILIIIVAVYPLIGLLFMSCLLPKNKK